jgi:acetylornithine/N-succinyldiaminopimelate aminotransferase
MMIETSVTQELIAQEHQYVVQTYSRPNFVLTRGEGMTLYDAEGNGYQDWVAGIAVNALGYNDAAVKQVMADQLSSGLIHLSNLYHNVPQIELAKLLIEKSFADRVFFGNSGTEANEGAIKFARRVAYNSGNPNKTELVTFSHAFHGRTMGSLSLTPKEKYQKPFKPMLAGVTVAEYNDIESARSAINENTCAVILEPIQGEGGIHAATPEFLQALRELCDQHKVVLIFDEIQCGVGRTGDLWAHSASGVSPDIMTIAKPLAAGLPIGAILVKQWIADHLQAGDHGTTFGGGPLVTSVAKHVIERVSQPEFLANVKAVGEYLQERLSEINSPLIKEVRGRGLMIGVELTIDVTPVVKAGYEHNLLLVNAGTNVIRLVPPLIAQKSDVDNLIEQLSTILEGLNA